MWQLRWARELPRRLLWGLALAGIFASVRFTIAPPRPPAPIAPVTAAATRDRAAEAYAALFARRYLTWTAADPQASMRALEPFVGPGMEPGAGLQLPLGGEQRVAWVEVVQERQPAPGEHVYTVAADTDTAGLVYLSVTVTRTAMGSLALLGYPALIGAPSAEPAQPRAHLREVADSALAMVVERALRNYLAASASELAADLAVGARTALPGWGMTLQSVARLDWTADGRSVVAVLQAIDRRGVRYTLAYELDVVRAQGRWEIAAIQMDPNA